MCIHKIFYIFACNVDNESGVIYTIKVEIGSLDRIGEFY